MRWTMASPRPLPLGEACRGTAGTGRRALPAECRCLRPARVEHHAVRCRVDRCGQPQPAAVGHRAQAVGREVPDDLLDLAFVGLVPELAVGGTSTSITCAVVHLGAVAQQQRGVVQRAAHVEPRDREPLRPRVGEKRSDRRVQPLRLAQHDVHQLFLLAAERQLLPQNLNRPDIDASGLRISCAMPAAISPTAASRCWIARVALELLDAR